MGTEPEEGVCQQTILAVTAPPPPGVLSQRVRSPRGVLAQLSDLG